ncbi:flagellar hook-length control protein FliK [Liquorilactobacillus vini]|uniref:Flagellar hook-length control protein FliK n=2 Tax=Liquorilactobacillus vini TaxID=238015 RepID=A0A0A7RIR3_9LACO|nr:flagellar hook-length control protein FliK [Liquorilactobacillus vini]AJA34499.1 flagellar hook-length control protein FliK [Liquorilactobacillus vini DSM 20605]
MTISVKDLAAIAAKDNSSPSKDDYANKDLFGQILSVQSTIQKSKLSNYSTNNKENLSKSKDKTADKKTTQESESNSNDPLDTVSVAASIAINPTTETDAKGEKKSSTISNATETTANLQATASLPEALQTTSQSTNRSTTASTSVGSNSDTPANVSPAAAKTTVADDNDSQSTVTAKVIAPPTAAAADIAVSQQQSSAISTEQNQQTSIGSNSDTPASVSPAAAKTTAADDNDSQSTVTAKVIATAQLSSKLSASDQAMESPNQSLNDSSKLDTTNLIGKLAEVNDNSKDSSLKKDNNFNFGQNDNNQANNAVQVTTNVSMQTGLNATNFSSATKQVVLDTTSNVSQNQLVNTLLNEANSSDLNFSTSSSIKTITVKLVPENLGDVQITMKVSQNQVSLEVKVQDTQVKQLFDKVADKFNQVIQNQSFLDPTSSSKLQSTDFMNNLTQMNFSSDSNESARQFASSKHFSQAQSAHLKFDDALKQQTAEQQTVYTKGTFSILV